MDEIVASSKVTIIWRSIVALTSIFAAGGIGSIFGYVKSADEKLTRIDSDVNLIKWEVPLIKATIANDKTELLKNINSLDEKIEKLRTSGETRREEISKLQLEQALLKQKLQIP